MRVNARFEGVAEQQVDYLVKATGRKVSDVLRESVAAYYAQIRGQEKGGLRYLGPLIGTGDSGRSDLSEHYKEVLAASWADKYAQATALALEVTAPPPDTTTSPASPAHQA